VAAEHVAYFMLTGLVASVVLTLQPICARHQNSCGAKAALQRVVSLERSLEANEVIILVLRVFDRVNTPTVDLHRKRQAGAACHAIDPDRAGATDPVLASHVRACCAQFVA